MGDGEQAAPVPPAPFQGGAAILAVTSFSQRGYEIYGRKCLESFVEHWPCKIVVWYEEKPDFVHEKVEYRNLLELPALTSFLKRLETVSDSDGIIDGRYDYRYDAKRFCKKVFVQEASFDLEERTYWLDADTVSKRPITSDFLGNLVSGAPFSYLGRKASYTETGFVGFNRAHPAFEGFRAKYQSAYTTGKIFSQTAGWHDCIAFDMAREGIKGNDLNAGTPYQGLDHCFPHTVIGEYIEHNKGPARKQKAYG